MKIKENIKLSNLNTFRTGGNARFFCEVINDKELVQALKFAKNKKIKFIVIGNGSNLLVSDKDYSGLVIKMSIKGIEKISENKQNSIISAGAGEDFDNLIEFSIKNRLYGIENLWNIPGTIGASAVQNIGAYGVEAKDFITEVEGINSNNFKRFILKKDKCKFKYRDSIFKKNKKLIITKVIFKLNNTFTPNLIYPSLKEIFKNKKNIKIEEVVKNISIIRKNKLPDWKKLGTAGSFFKNPVITNKKYNQILRYYPDLPKYTENKRLVKIPLGYVIDKICGLKGFRKDNVGLFDKQSLVVVNYGKAKYSEINYFAKIIEKKVFEKIKIKIEREVEII